MKLLSALLTSLALVFPALADTVQPEGRGISAWPVGCHALSRTESAISADAQVPSSIEHVAAKLRSIRKFDVICIGDKIRLDTPIYTNGGDLLIFADTIHIDSEINTRIATAYSVYDHFLDPDSTQPAPPRRGTSGFVNALSAMEASSNEGFRSLAKSYRAYYECYDCISGPDGKIYTFSGPAGFTSAYYNFVVGPVQYREGIRKYDGIKTPSAYMDRSAINSGSVFIYAGNISLGQGAKIDVSGGRGGIGGAGEPPNCIIELANISCLESMSVMQPALNSPGGDGSDAGSVQVAVFSESEPGTATLIARLKNVIVANGGASGPSEKRRSAPTSVKRKYLESIADFEIENDAWPPSRSGKDGSVVIENETRTGAITRFLEEALTRDALRIYDLQELAIRAETDSTIHSVSISDYLQLSGYKLLARSMAAMSDTAIETISHNAPASNKYLAASFICPESITPFSKFFPDFYILAVKSKPYCVTSGGVLSHFLEQTGGLFRINNSDPGLTVRLDEIRREVIGSKVDLKEIQAGLARSEQQLIAIYETVERHRMEDQIVALKNELRNVETAIAKEQSKDSDKLGSIVGLVGAVYGAGNSAAIIYGVLSNGAAGSTSSETDSKKFKESSRELARNISEIRTNSRNILAENISDTDLNGQRSELIREVGTLNSAISEFIAGQLKSKDLAQNRIADKLIAALRTKAYEERAARLVSASFEDLLKVTLVSYLSDPSRRIDLLITNASNIEDMLISPRQGLLDAQLNRQLPRCNLQTPSTNPGACISLTEAGRSDIFFDLRVVRSGGDIDSVPLLLYRIEQGASGQVFESHGVGPVRIVSVSP